ncbi:MAG: MazG nucleotide pyrophosphohydrolase domain-containing protein, partial [Rhodospirillaceae bacterium]
MTNDSPAPVCCAVDRLIAIVARLRDPVRGCPWDVAQSFQTVAPHTIEEAYEVADAVELGDMKSLCDELGDLLFQVVLHSQMAHERGAFDFKAVTEAIASKMIRRHPHVFADDPTGTAADVIGADVIGADVIGADVIGADV